MKTYLKVLLLGLILLSVGSNLEAQINVTGGLTGQQLASILSGTNIAVSNVTLGGSPLASGSFVSSNGFDFASGIILSTGTLDNCVGPNNDPNTSDNLGFPGDPLMDILGGGNSWDAVWLEFDFTVQSSSVHFEYMFGSEDYPEAAPPNNPSFNDVFAFFISGPGIVGEENIALIPGTVDEVSILNVNPITNAQYYVDNTGGQEIQFDGYTTPLIAFRDNLVPCGTYHLKLIISDIHNINRNSAVFLKENSFVQENVLGVETQTVNSDGIALEGCIEGCFTFAFDQISNQDRIITYTIDGTAVNGVDYAYMDTTIMIPAGELEGTICIDAFADGIPEGQEEIWLIYPSGGCLGTDDTVYLTINDSQSIDFTLDGFNLDCYDDFTGEIQVNATGGFPPYTFYVTDPNMVESQTQSNPITGLEAGTYTVQVYDSYGCQADALVIGGVYDADTTFLPDVPGGQVITYDAPLPISGFNPGQTIADVSQIQQICLTLEHSYLGDLKIEVEAPSGEIIVLKQQNGGGSCDLGEPIATGPVDGAAGSLLTDPGVGYEYCFNASPVYGTMVGESNNFTRNYTDGLGNSYTDQYLPAGSYTPFESFNGLVGADMNGTWTVHVTDQFNLDNGYIFNWYISLIGDMPDTLVILTQPDEIVTTGFITNSTCGGTDGAINIEIQDAVAPYTVLWSSGQTIEDISGIGAGIYTVTVTDANGCQSIETFLVNNIGSLDITSSSTATSCFGGADGTIDITPSGGTLPYTFSWNSGQATEDISGLVAGNYTVTMTDQQGCMISEIVTVNSATQVIISTVSVQDEECNTDNGAIDISVSGGSGSYGYQWSNNESSEDISGLNSGTYIVNIIDGNGCAQQESYSIINNLSNCSSFCYLDIVEDNLESENCGQGNGSIDIAILNAVYPITIEWSNSMTVEDISNLSAGTYTVAVTDANNCSVTQSFVIVNNASVLISSAIISDENCGNTDGSVDITVAGGAMPYSYNWTSGDMTEDVVGLPYGNYTVTVTDGNGCQTSEEYSITNNSGSLSATATIVPETCTSSNGSINQIVSGGNGVLTYNWSSGQITQDISGLAEGDYTSTITDETGCSVTNTFTVAQTTGDISLIGSNITNEACGNGQGAVNITLSGQNQTYLWSNGATTEDLTGVAAGNYYCIISNAQGCEFTTQEFTVINSSGTLNVSTQLAVDETCSNGNGSINMNITGGTLPYTFNWSNGSTDEDLIGLSSGTYSLLVTDAAGCSESHSIIIENNSGTLAIDNAIIVHENCGDQAGSIDLIVSGGTQAYTYTWSNTEITEDLLNLSVGTYEVAVIDQNGCEVTGSYSISNETGNFAVSSQITNEVCSNGAGIVDLTVTGGTAPYTFNWSNAAITEDITGLTSGTYSCSITDASGCIIITETFTINNTPNGISTSVVVTDAVCSNDGSIDLTVIGGTVPFTYDWSNSFTGEDPTGLGAGTYTYTVTDGNSCISAGSVDIIATNAGIIYSISTSGETCSNGSGTIDLTVTGGAGGYTYVWSNTAVTEDLTGLSEGLYSCVISDVNGCTITTNDIQITNGAGTLEILDMSVSNEVCSNGLGYIDLTTNGGSGILTFLWSNAEITEDVAGLTAGIYSVTVTDAIGCSVSSQVTMISESGTMQIMQPIVIDESCSNGQGSINITVQGGVNPTFLWSNGEVTEDINNLSAGTYTVNITDANGCAVNATYTVNNDGSSFGISSAIISDEYCGSGTGSIEVVVSGGAAPYNYLWSNGGTSSILSNLSTGAYSVLVSDAGGCGVTGNYMVANDAGNLAVSGSITDENCGDGAGAIDITTNGGNIPLAYAWDSGDITEDLSNISAGIYNLVISDNFGCTANYSGTVSNITNGLTVSIASVTDEICGQADGAIDVTIAGAGIVSTVWSSGQLTEDISGIGAGTYILTVVNNVGCIATAQAIVSNQTGTLAVTFSNVGNENCNNGQGFVDIEVSGTGPFIYNWSDGQTTQDAIGLSAGLITVTITDGLGCDLTQQFTVNNLNSTNISITSAITDATCTQSDGEIDIMVNGGIAPYSFLWSTTDVTEDINGLLPGSYDVTVTDGASCQATQTIVVSSQSSGLGFTNLDITADFCGQCNGDITFFTGGTADDYYLDGVNLGGWLADNLCAGTYTVSISDNAGCWVDSVVTVAAAATFNVNDITINESCGLSNGSINITVTGGPGGYTFLWNTGATTEDLIGIAAGTYTVTVSTTAGPGGGCDFDYSVVVGNDVSFTLSSLITDDYCGQGVGAINQTMETGSTNLSFSWSTGATTEDVMGLTEGTYTCTVVDLNPGGCTEIYTYVLVNGSNGVAGSGVVTNEFCGDGTGAIDITVVGGVGPYTYSWDSGPITEDISSLSSGVYVVTITDGTGCEITNSYTIGNGAGGFDFAAIVTHETCGNMNGAIDLVITGGVAPITFNWSNAATTEDVSGLDGGLYTCTITDNTGCELYVSETINSLSENFVMGAAVIVDEQCGDGTGSITLNTTGGTGPLSYNWDNPNPCCSYTVLLHDNNNNGWGGTPAPEVIIYLNGIAFGNFTIPTGAGNNLETIDVPLCDGDLFEIEYVQAAQNGNNWYEVLDNQGTQIFTDGPNPFNGVAYSAPAVCSGGNTNPLTNLNAGSYPIEITDVNGCVLQDIFTVNNITTGGFGISSFTITDEVCGDGTGAIDITVTGIMVPYTFYWNTGATTEDIAGLTSGIYGVTVTDGTGCEVNGYYTVNSVGAPIVVTGVAITDASCPTCTEGMIDLTLDPSGAPFTFLWSTTETTEDISNLPPGTYTVTITNIDGCSEVFTYTVMDMTYIDEEVLLSIGLAVAPNPASSSFQVNHMLPEGQRGEIVITDAIGRLVKTVDVVGQNELIINSESFAPGMYFVTLESRKITKMEKVIITENK